ncbi:MAG: hypothetical protein ABI488_01380 [Polyangiaceae bacterium]
MKTNAPKTSEAVVPAPHSSHAVEAAAGALGVVGGASTGALLGGPVGAIAGAVIGAAMGAASGWAADQASADQADAEAALDEAIGVTSGTIGTPGLEHPPGQTNAPSAAASGASGGTTAESEADGPMQTPGD